MGSSFVQRIAEGVENRISTAAALAVLLTLYEKRSPKRICILSGLMESRGGGLTSAPVRNRAGGRSPLAGVRRRSSLSRWLRAQPRESLAPRREALAWLSLRSFELSRRMRSRDGCPLFERSPHGRRIAPGLRIIAMNSTLSAMAEDLPPYRHATFSGQCAVVARCR